MPKTNAERQADYRTRQSQDKVLVRVWVKPENVQKVREFAVGK